MSEHVIQVLVTQHPLIFFASAVFLFIIASLWSKGACFLVPYARSLLPSIRGTLRTPLTVRTPPILLPYSTFRDFAATNPRRLPLQGGTGTWSRLSSPFSALRGGGASRVTAPALSPPPSSHPAVAQRATAARTGWTATMAEPLLDMCFDTFFKYGAATLPLLPEVLALHQVRVAVRRGGGLHVICRRDLWMYGVSSAVLIVKLVVS